MGAPGLIRERYEPIQVIGRGGQGHVLRARDHHHGRTVALKVRDLPGGVARGELLAEARVLLELAPHPGIAIVRDDLFVDDRHCLVMDWIEGRSLRRVLADEGRPGLPLEQVMPWLVRVAESLDHIHAHRPPVIHGDVKPDNVILTPDGRVVLVDFGLAGPNTAQHAGTSCFRAPELASGGARTAASDVFSLGATAYALLTGEAPEPGADADWTAVPEQWRAKVRSALACALSAHPAARPASATAFVAALAPPATPHNLPAPMSTFIGRAHELAHAGELLRTARLVTFSGIGGIGKTRLAVEAGYAAMGAYPDGIAFVDLAPVSLPAHVARAVARAIGVREVPGRAIDELIAGTLGAGRRLLILDNCEHLVAHCAEVADRLLRACPELTILATSREPLRVDGEHLFSVPPMRSEMEATRLFDERARAAGADPPLPDEPIADLCERLDGIPLAIELAAAQRRTLTVQQISDGLEDRFGLLVGGSRPQGRHETLQAALDWSHALLNQTQRAVLRRLAVFTGSFDAAAAQAVCDVDRATTALRHLVDASLVAAETGRYRLLDTMRGYAAARLEGAGEQDEVRRAHAKWFAGLVERAVPELRGAAQAVWLATLEADIGNLRAALSWGLQHDADLALRTAGALGMFWEGHGHFSEGREWLGRALERSEAAPTASRARGLTYLGWLAYRQGDKAAAASLGEALDLWRELGDREREAEVVGMLGSLALTANDIDGARARFEESLAHYRELGLISGVARGLNNLGAVEGIAGRLDKARALMAEAAALWEQAGDRANVARSLMNVGVAARAAGEDDEARALFGRSLTLARELGDRGTVTFCLMNLGELERLAGDASRAAATLSEGLELARAIGDQRAQATLLSGLGDVARAQGSLAQSRQLLESSLAIRRQLGDERGQAAVLGSLGLTSLREDDVATATALCERARELATRLDDPSGALLARIGLAVAAARMGQRENVAALLGEADRIRERLSPQDRELRDEAARAGGILT
jgi:non-specific serine/threonine protein kinase